MNDLCNTLLPVRPSQLSSEGAKGYLLRLASSNGIYLSHLKNESTSDLSKELLSNKLDLTKNALLKNDPSSAFWDHQIASKTMQWNWINRKCCSVCLQDSQVWRVEWEFRHLTVCPIHKVRLTDRCPECKRQLSWQTQVISECQCGYDLRTSPQIACTDDEALLAGAIRASVGQQAIPEQLSFLRMCTPVDLMRVVNYLGNLINGESSVQRISARDLKVITPIFAEAARILSNWPESYRGIVKERIPKKLPDANSIRLPQVLGRLYTALYLGNSKDSLAFIRAEFEKILVTEWQWSFTRRNKRLSEESRSESSWMPAAQAAKKMGTSVKKLSAMVNGGTLEGRIITSATGRIHMVVNVNNMDVAQFQLSNEINLADASALMGVSDKRVLELMDAGVIRNKKKSSDGSGQWVLSRTELTSILDLSKNLPVETVDKLPSTILLSNLLRSGLRGPQSFPSLMDSIVKGKLEIRAVDPNYPAISGWVIGDAQYQEWLDAQVDDGVVQFSLQKVAALLRTKEEVAYRMVKLGLLKTKSVERNRRSLQMVTLAELQKFQERFVFNTRLAEQSKICPRALMKKLADMGIKPYIPVGTKSDSAIRQCFYEKSSKLDWCMERVCG